VAKAKKKTARKRPIPAEGRSHYASVKHVIYLSTNVLRGCEFCDESFGGLDSLNLAEAINHYLRSHACTLLHVGTETVRDDEVKPWHSSVAILGAARLPPKRPDVLSCFLREQP
jgi:hypothetical protein